MKKLSNKEIEVLNNIRILKKYKNCKIYAEVLSVSRSGMSRKLKIYAIKNNKLNNLTFYISKVLGYSLNSDRSMTVCGCGMDMIFNTLYDVNGVAFNKKAVRVSKNQTEHDLRYNGVLNTNYNWL